MKNPFSYLVIPQYARLPIAVGIAIIGAALVAAKIDNSTSIDSCYNRVQEDLLRHADQRHSLSLSMLKAEADAANSLLSKLPPAPPDVALPPLNPVKK